MQKILFIRKDGLGSLSTDEIIKIFEENDDLNSLNDAVTKAQDRLFISWASVEMKDKQDELIPIDDLIQQQRFLLERNGPITDEHTNRVIGETLAYKVLEHPKTNTLGILHLNKIFSHTEFDDQIWKEITSGTRTGSSVGGFNTSESQGKDRVTNSDTTFLHGFRQFETASVYDPANPLALNEACSVVAKSNRSKSELIDRLDNFINKINEQKINTTTKGDNMAEDKILKRLDSISMGFDDLNKRLMKLEVKEDEEKPKEEEEEPQEETKKQDEEEEPKQEDEETKQEDEEEELVEESKKENAAGEIAGESGAETPEPPEVEQPNDEDTFKMNKAALKKLVKDTIAEARIVSKGKTPRGNIGSYGAIDVKKSDQLNTMAMKLATGKIKKSWPALNNWVAKHNDVRGEL